MLFYTQPRKPETLSYSRFLNQSVISCFRWFQFPVWQMYTKRKSRKRAKYLKIKQIKTIVLTVLNKINNYCQLKKGALIYVWFCICPSCCSVFLSNWTLDREKERTKPANLKNNNYLIVEVKWPEEVLLPL